MCDYIKIIMKIVMVLWINNGKMYKFLFILILIFLFFMEYMLCIYKLGYEVFYSI